MTYTYITPAGATYPLETFSRRRTRAIISIEGTGMPEMDLVTSRGPVQHGVSLEDWYLKERTIQIVMRHQYSCKQEYWAGRTALLQALLPSTTLATLRARLPNGDRRDIKVIVAQGPVFEPSSGWDEWGFTTVVRFLAPDPTFYDPNATSQSWAPAAALGTFPMTFPVAFVGFTGSNVIVYGGSWPTYPTITITGPVQSPIITNVTTGQAIWFDYLVAVGETVVIDLVEKTAVSSVAGNLLGSVFGDFATFQLALGSNTFTVYGSGVSAATIITMSWYNRYVGLGA